MNGVSGMNADQSVPSFPTPGTYNIHIPRFMLTLICLLPFLAQLRGNDSWKLDTFIVVKASARDPQRQQELAAALAAAPPEFLSQVDTFFWRYH
ncbi:MAG: hypothetical protein ABSH20_02585 [Tepidisphaeraceae bacterium]|jgi:hypothetical protein